MSDSSPYNLGPGLLTVDDMAALLKVSKATIYRMVESRLIAVVRLPRGLRFDPEDVRAFLRGRRVESVATL